MEEREIAIKIEGLRKRYRLGTIGGGTLKGDLESWWALKRGKEDPNSKIGAKTYKKNEIFYALDGIDLTIYKGERIGIIGHNGAGKSTLLKLLSRVTAPTEGRISIDGRIASMLEVGTGFNGELTGRENVYLNGAILGMSKAEVDAKIEQIIDFSEVRQFIDTPVKRYSSGMYVKLAFSVAAHLDSEIMIMDEVLAVGDMAFQKKCLAKMREVSEDEGRTVLYVSHNMNTIRQLCDRIIVLDHGKVVFEGDIEKGISIYLSVRNYSGSIIKLTDLPREKRFDSGLAKMTRLEMNNSNGVFQINSVFKGILTIYSFSEIDNVILKITFCHNSQAIMTSESEIKVSFKTNEQLYLPFELKLGGLAPAIYTTKMVLSCRDNRGNETFVDVLTDSYMFRIIEPEGFQNNKKWNPLYSGFFIGEEILINYD